MRDDYAAVAAVLVDLPALVRERRLARGVGLRELAVRVRVHHTTLWRFERGELDLRTHHQVELLAWLDETSLREGRS